MTTFLSLENSSNKQLHLVLFLLLILKKEWSISEITLALKIKMLKHSKLNVSLILIATGSMVASHPSFGALGKELLIILIITKKVTTAK